MRLTSYSRAERRISEHSQTGFMHLSILRPPRQVRIGDTQGCSIRLANRRASQGLVPHAKIFPRAGADQRLTRP